MGLCPEVDESMPSIDSVFNSVSAVKWIYIYVKNIVTVPQINPLNLCGVFYLVVLHLSFHIAEILISNSVE